VILGLEQPDNLQWFHTALDRCRGVARIETSNGHAIGTGFLLDGRALHPDFRPLVLLTAGYVIGDSGEIPLDEARVTFRSLGDKIPLRLVRTLWSSPPPNQFDATVVELAGYPVDAVPLPVAPRRPRLVPTAETYIVGHPRGSDQVQLSIRDNRLLDADDRRLHYRTPTAPGSGGSPVFDSNWEVIALHHAGGSRMPRLNGQPGTYAANEGIWLDRIVTELTATDDTSITP
jgi:hypothetical protein